MKEDFQALVVVMNGLTEMKDMVARPASKQASRFL